MPRLDRILTCLYIALALLPASAMLLHCKDHRLDGALPRTSPPALTAAAVWREDYQAQLTSWFELDLGLRNWAIWIDNTLLFHGFGETKWGSHVAIGRDDVLFERDDINYVNKAGAALPDPREVDKLAEHIASLQQRLRGVHRALVPIFVPSKTTIYRDELPDLWLRPFGEPRPSTERVYLAMKRALDARRVVYIDGIALLSHAAESRSLLWGMSARHYSNYSGCLCVREIVQRYAELTGTEPFDYPCQANLKPAMRKHSDLDLFRLLNAWDVPHDPLQRDVLHEPLPSAPPPDAPRALWISSSFGWVMMGDAELSRRFAQLHIDYYNNTVFEAGTHVSFDAKQHDDRWRSVFLTRDLYIIELNETYLTPGNFFGADALDALDAELGPLPGPQ